MHKAFHRFLSGLLLVLFAARAGLCEGLQHYAGPQVVQRPSDMAWDDLRHCLVVLDERNSLLTTFTECGDWPREIWELPHHYSDIEWVGASGFLLSPQTTAIEQLELTPTPTLRRTATTTIALPTRLAGTTDGHQTTLAVCSQWKRQFEILQINEPNSPMSMGRKELSFPPGEMLFHPSGKWLIIADAFQGHFSVVDCEQGTIISSFELPIHNIAGLQWESGRRLLVTCQKLHPNPTTDANIAGGLVLEHLLLTLELDDSLQELGAIHEVELGTPSQGAADPTGIGLDSQGKVLVSASGANQLVRLTERHQVSERIDVGRRPTQIISDTEQRRFLVLEEFTPAIRIIDMESGVVRQTLSFGPMAEKTPADRGEELFFDARLSLFEWMTCHSCHGHGHTNGRLADTFGDGNAGAPKAVLSLLGTRDNNPWAWNGSMQTLHGQVTKSLQTTMHSPKVSAIDTIDLVAYLHTLAPPPPLAEIAADDLLAGRKLFDRLGCAKCHIPPLTYTSDLTYDVGLPDEHGQKKFNPPSLLGVGQRFGYFHDLRSQSLKSALINEGHQINELLTPAEFELLVRYLQSL